MMGSTILFPHKTSNMNSIHLQPNQFSKDDMQINDFLKWKFKNKNN